MIYLTGPGHGGPTLVGAGYLEGICTEIYPHITNGRGGAAASNTVGYTPSMSKVMVSLPDDLLAELDAEVKRRTTTRSALLALAARRELARRDRAEIAAAIERSERRFRAAGSFESADLVRADRDDRR